MTEVDKRQLDEQGYFLIENLMGAALLDQVRRRVDELFAQVMRRLRGRPGGQLPILELRHRAGRPDRAVGVDGEIVRGLDRLGAGAA